MRPGSHNPAAESVRHRTRTIGLGTRPHHFLNGEICAWLRNLSERPSDPDWDWILAPHGMAVYWGPTKGCRPGNQPLVGDAAGKPPSFGDRTG